MNLRWRSSKFFRSLDNWRRGYAFGYVRRCRVCGHTAYAPSHPDHGMWRTVGPKDSAQ